MAGHWRFHCGLVRLLAVTGCVLLGSGPTLAQLVEWTGNSSADWATAANWSPAAVPAAGDNVIINTLAPNSPVLDGLVTPALGDIQVGESLAAELLIINGASLTGSDVRIGSQSGGIGSVTVNNANWEIIGNLFTGHSGTGSIDVRGGSGVSTSAQVFVGYETGSSGSVRVREISGWTIGGDDAVLLGHSGSGVLSVEEASGVQVPGITLGVSETGEGSVSLQAGSLLVDSAGECAIGIDGRGDVEVLSGGYMFSRGCTIGTQPNGEGAVLVSGPSAVWQDVGVLSVGFFGTGELRVENGGVVMNTSASIGREEGGCGEVWVIGPGSTWLLNSATIGAHGDGFLQISDGGSVISQSGTIGSAIGSQGRVRLVDAGSTWDVTRRLNIGLSGQGSLEVGQGAVLSAGEVIRVAPGASSEGLLTLEGGVVNADDGLIAHANGILSGDGVINGWVRIENGGLLSPGLSAVPGTVDVSGALELRPDAHLHFSLGAPGVVGGGVNDLITVGGDLILDGEVEIDMLPGFGHGLYTLISYSGSLTDNGLTVGSIPPGYLLAVDTSLAGEVRLVVERYIPEYFPVPGLNIVGLSILALLLALMGLREIGFSRPRARQ